MQRIHRRLRRAGFVYGLLQILFVTAGIIPTTRSEIFSSPELPSFPLELSLVCLLVVLFLVGLIVWSHTELGAGLVFLIWFALVVWADLFSTRYGMGGGAAPLLGSPGLVLGLVLVYGWLLNRFAVFAPPTDGPGAVSGCAGPR